MRVRTDNRRLSGIFRRALVCRVGKEFAIPFGSSRTPGSRTAVFVGAMLLLSACWPCLFAAETNAPAASTIDGTWRWTFTMPDGTTSQPKLVLKTAQGVLAGTTSFRPGSEAPITNAVLRANQVRFDVVRHRNGRAIFTTYSGVWSGRFIRGTIVSDWAGEKRSYPWEARRDHEGAEGEWRWTVATRAGKVEGKANLQQAGDSLTGAVFGSGPGARQIRVSRGSVTNETVYFEIERGAGAARVLTVYKGKQSGNTIKGTVTTIAGGRKRAIPWLASRVE